MDLSPQQPSDFGIFLFLAVIWFFPIGVFVMRRHLEDATGWMGVLKGVMYGLACATAPLAAFTLVVIPFAIYGIVRLLGSMLKVLLW